MSRGLVKVLFVCTGNICRSPTAAAVYNRLARVEGLHGRTFADSAGTYDYNVGGPADPRARHAAQQRGYDLRVHRARLVQPEDFNAFEYVLGMDQGHVAMLRELCPPEYAERIGLLMDYAPELGVREVEDPFGGEAADFERVLDLVEAGVRGLLQRVRGAG